MLIRDSEIGDVGEGHTEPDVTINGNELRMVQTTDGNWYAYFADVHMARAADGLQTGDNAGHGLDFGTIGQATGIFDDADAVAMGDTLNVIRQAKDINTRSGDNSHLGDQRGTIIGAWQDGRAVIQLFEFNPTGNVVIQYNKGGGAQTTTLTFDTVDGYAGIELDRASYPQSAYVHATITDTWLNIDPTDEDSWTFDTNSGAAYYQLFDERGNHVGSGTQNIHDADIMCDDNCVLLLDTAAQGSTVIDVQENNDGAKATAEAHGISQPVTVTEQGPNSGIFGTYDELDDSVLVITDDAERGKSATIDYNDTPTTVLVAHDFAEIDIQPTEDMWKSGQEIPVVLKDADLNKNSRADEDIILNDPTSKLIPSLVTGDPFTLGEGSSDLTVQVYSGIASGSERIGTGSAGVEAFSERAIVELSSNTVTNGLLVIDLETTAAELFGTISNNVDFLNNEATINGFKGYNLFNYDVSSMGDIEAIKLVWSTGNIDVDAKLNIDEKYVLLVEDGDRGLASLNADQTAKLFAIPADANIGLAFKGTNFKSTSAIVSDFFSFGFDDDGEQASERTANQIIRLELEEDGDDTEDFVGSLTYTMINQLNVLDEGTYDFDTISDAPTFIVFEDLTDEDAPRVNYLDLGADGVSTQIADQQEAPSHSGTVKLDGDNYKVADTVTITLTDPDLNVDSDLIDIFTTVDPASGDSAGDAVGKENLPTFKQVELGRLVDVTFDDSRWTYDDKCGDYSGDKSLFATGFTLIETGIATGIFTGDFQIPSHYCDGEKLVSATGVDIEVNYVDFRDASGEIIEVTDSAGVRANTGTISLDRAVYPVPWGTVDDGTRSVFPIHATGVDGAVDQDAETLGSGDLTIHVRINDPDYDISAAGEDVIAEEIGVSGGTVGPVKISISRGPDEVVLAYAGYTNDRAGLIDVGGDNPTTTRQLGPITEVAPDAGIFELDFTIRYTDGPADSICPSTDNYSQLDDSISATDSLSRFDASLKAGEDYCILQGDILTVEYTDPTDASGDPNTVTDSATFDLRNGLLQSDKSVYIIGSDIILTLIEPDWDLDNDAAETYDLDVIEWDSDAATLTIGDAGGDAAAFDPEPSALRETGDSTGIFQVVLETPAVLAGDSLERGEEIGLEYTDWGPAGSDYVGQEDEDVTHTIFTSNFGATVELDQKVYSWTDKVYITIVAPDHNFDSDLVDEIGNTGDDPIQIATRSADLDQYKLVETGTNTGIFTGEITLTGFEHDADGDGDNDAPAFTGSSVGGPTTNIGPTNGFLETDDDDGITVSFEFSEDETIVGSALIRWNIGAVEWLEASYPASGQAVLRVVDPDMNLNPESVDNFEVDVWSDSDSGGIDLTVTETNESTGIFEGTVQFTLDDSSSGHRLRISEGDIITAEYEDNTLPDPYTRADELDITATSLIGTAVAPLDRAPASNLRIVDSFGNALDGVSAGSQVQITADLMNGQDRDQAFAYIVQIEDANGVAVELAWLTGSLNPEQSLSPALSWTPQEMGTYSASIFVWESLDTPTALSPSLELDITVN